MIGSRAVPFAVAFVLVTGLASISVGIREQAGPIQPHRASRGLATNGPLVILQQGDTTWVQPYPDTTHCPGDRNAGHGGEAAGGPDGSRTWCFEGGSGDTCGTNPPWDTNCFDHIDVRTLPSSMGINYWHIDTYRTDQAPYCGNYCLWCGSDGTWDGQPVECGTWANPPGYGNQWNCIVQLDLDSNFTVATGCTLYFDLRYDTECMYDYLYLEFWDGATWDTLAKFTATSNNPGDTCYALGVQSPDYWGNSNAGQPYSCDWQGRSDPAVPAFAMDIAPHLGSVTEAPMLRWRFYSDGFWSDRDSEGDTDEAAFIDNVWVVGDPGNVYIEDFEHGEWDSLASRGWGLPDADPVAQGWHQVHDPDPPYEGNDGGDRTSCQVDSSMMWRGRPEGGYPGAASWRNGWYYRLLSPKVAIPEGAQGTGCVVQYDQYMCTLECTCDYTDTKVRFHDAGYGTWCPWINIDERIFYGCSEKWDLDKLEDVSRLYGPGSDSVQFAWDLMDVSSPGAYCLGKHRRTDYQVDNVSIGFFDGSATMFMVRSLDLLHDSFHDSICGHNSSFDVYDSDTLAWYSGPPYIPEIPVSKQLYIDIIDKNGLQEVRLYGSIDHGATWIFRNMALAEPYDPDNPSLGGEYYGTLCPDDFGLSRWDRGTEVWYYVWAEDQNTNTEYFPSAVNPASPSHTGTGDDYFTFSILPLFSNEYAGTKILLIDGYQQSLHDWSPCVEELENRKRLADIYGKTLIDAGYCYDKFDINAAGISPHIHPVEYNDYDAIVWFTGPELDRHLFHAEAQFSMRDYLAGGGKVVLCGDRISYAMVWPCPPGYVCGDTLGGEFYKGFMGAVYVDEVESPFDKPYVYLVGVDTINVFGQPVAIELDSLLLYRGCPGHLRDMSYVLTTTDPYPGYTAQPILEVLKPGVPEADGAIYTESPGGGQCVFINFDLSAMVNHGTSCCDGITPDPVPDFEPGSYEGRVEVMRVILEGIMGLTPPFPAGGGGTADVEPKITFRWALAQNVPNPFTVGTEICFEIAQTRDVSIKVYSVKGQLVRTLVDERMQPGRYSLRWEGTNTIGNKASSGVYFYKMEAGDYSATKKMLLVN